MDKIAELKKLANELKEAMDDALGVDSAVGFAAHRLIRKIESVCVDCESCRCGDGCRILENSI